MKEGYSVEELKKTDVPIVVDIVRTSFENDQLIPSIYRSKGIESFIKYELENIFSPYKYFVIRNEKIIVGYAEFKVVNDLAFLNIISVNRNHSNKGVGGALFFHCLNYFKLSGIEAIHLDVYNSNTVATNWYNKLGFKEISIVSFFKLELNNKILINKKFTVQNYPQFRELENSFGFYFIELKSGNQDFRIGFINNDIIIRGNYNSNYCGYINFLKEFIKIKNAYFIGSVVHKYEELKYLDEIIRMELTIN